MRERAARVCVCVTGICLLSASVTGDSAGGCDNTSPETTTCYTSYVMGHVRVRLLVLICRFPPRAVLDYIKTDL